jgi:tetratricopeptide (TPR) repeat protein
MSRSRLLGVVRRSISAVLVLLVLLVMRPILPARAQPGPEDGTGEADRLLRRGLELEKRGRKAEAFEYLRNAYSLSPLPRIAAELGRAEQAVGLSVEAERHLATALSDRESPWIRKNRASLLRSLSKVRNELGVLLVTMRDSLVPLRVRGL